MAVVCKAVVSQQAETFRKTGRSFRTDSTDTTETNCAAKNSGFQVSTNVGVLSKFSHCK